MVEGRNEMPTFKHIFVYTFLFFLL